MSQKTTKEWEVEKLLGQQTGGAGDGQPKDVESQTRVEPVQKSREKVIFAVSSYWVVSLSLVFLNKFAMSEDPDLKEVPLFFVWTQLIAAVLIMFVLSQLGQAYKQFAWFPPFEYKLDIAWKIAPLSVIFVAMITFNNLCLKEVNVSFYQVARSLTMVFNIIFSGTMFQDWPSKRAISCCVVVIIGYLIGSDAELDLGSVTYTGIVYGVLASIFVALYGIYVKEKNKVVDGNKERLMMYNNINSSFLLLIVSMTQESVYLPRDTVLSGSFWGIICGAGFLGFAINYVSFLQITYTSPLTHNVSGTAKACCQTIIAIIILGDNYTRSTLIGFFTVVGGSAAYTVVRKQEMEAAKKTQERSNS